MANPILNLALPAETLAYLARLADREAKQTSSVNTRRKMREASAAIQQQLDTVPCPTCHGALRIRHSVWDHFLLEIAEDFPEWEAIESHDYEIERRRARFAAEHGPEWESCPRCQAPSVVARRAA